LITDSLVKNKGELGDGDYHDEEQSQNPDGVLAHNN
jgi:hypothetical protein